MAYALRYYKEIAQTDGGVVRLEIHKKDSTTSAVEIGAVVQGLSLEIQGQQGDIDTPIQKTSLHMTFVDASDIENGQKNGFWEEFYTPDALLWKVILKAKDAKETAFRTIWGGYVTPDSFSEDLVYRGSVSITARDNIGHMQDFPFDALGDADGMISLRNLLEGGWEKIASPMQLILNPQFTLYCDGVPAYDTLMNVSAFEGMDWYKAIESALASYGMVMRYTGDNIVHVGALRFMPHFGWVDVESMPHVEPTFITGATRELVPAVKRIEESVDYDEGDFIAPQVQQSDFTGEVESIRLQTSTGVSFFLESWTIKNEEEGEGWVNNDYHAPYFNPTGYDMSELDENDSHDGEFMWFAFSQYITGDNRFALYSRRMMATRVSMRLAFGPAYRLVDGALSQVGSARANYAMIAIEVVKDGVSSFLQSDGSWGGSLALLTYRGEQIADGELIVDLPTDEFDGSVILNVRIYEAGLSSWELDTYIPLYDLSFTANNVVMEKNTINTIYNAENNVILSRNPEIGPSYDKVAFPGFIKNGMFVRVGNEIHTTKEWAWSGGTPLQMAVYNHLQLLCYYAKPNNFISGTIVKTDLSRMGNIWMWHGAEHILVSGRYNFLNGHIESAVLREFARYEDMWTEVSGAGLPDTEQESRTNVEGSSTGSSSAPSYTSTTTVNIGSGGGGGGTGASYLNDLLDVNVANAGAQSLLYYNGTEWAARSFATLMNPYLKSDVAQETYATKASLATLEAAVQDNAGNIKKNFDAISVLQSGKADKATTLAGYGIKDAYTKTETDNLLAKYVLLEKANQTIKGDIRIEGNLVVTGDTASGGASGGGGTSIGVSGIFVNGETRRDDDGDGIIVLPDYPTSLEWSAINGKPTKLSEFTDDILSGKYLPLTGGTISMTSVNALKFKKTTDALALVGFEGKKDGADASLGWLGFYGVDNPVFRGTDTGVYSLLHSGNVGSYKAGDSDKLGGYYITQVLPQILQSYRYIEAGTDLDTLIKENAGWWNSRDNIDYTNGPKRNFGLFSARINTAYFGQLAFGYGSSELMYRSQSYSSSGVIWNPWKTIAFTDSNVASATKLQTARTIWGQSFDGTGNVTGNLYLGSNILYGGNNYNILDISGGSGLNIGYGIRSVGSTVYWAKSHAFYVGDSHALTINSSGNVGIGTASPEYKLDVVGKARISDELIVTNPTGIRWAYGDYGTLFRNDGQHFYILFTDSGGALTGSWNNLRPFRISLTTGDVTMEHNLNVDGTIKSSSVICGTSRLRVNSPTNGGVFGYMDAQLFGTTTNVSSVHIGSCYGGASSLDNTAEYPSGVSMTAISIYRGRVGIGKRWSDTELRALHDANCSLGVWNNAHIMGNLAVSSIYSDNGQSGAAGVVLRNEGGIEISHASTPYIDFHFANSTSDFNHRLIARANNIFAYSGNYFCPWGSESLGASSYRWQYVYAKAGSFSHDMEINGALTVGAGAIFNGDVRINGNLVVTGDTASGGAGQETTLTSQLLVINQLIPEGTSVSQSALDAIGLTSDVIDDLIEGKYHHVLEVIGSNKSLYTISGYKSTTTREFILQYGSAEADTAWWYSFRQYNGGIWSVTFDEI